MRVYTEIKYKMLPNGGLELVSSKHFNYEGPVAECLRAEEGAAMDAAGTAKTTAANLGTAASSELGAVSPFYSREMHAEHAFDPTNLNELLTTAGAGVGAAAGAADTQFMRDAAHSGNPAGDAKVEQQMARDRMKAAAGVSEGVASQDVLGAAQLRQEGAAGEAGLYGENLKGQLAAMGQESTDINAATQANQTGWLQQAEGIAKTGAGIASAFAKP